MIQTEDWRNTFCEVWRYVGIRFQESEANWTLFTQAVAKVIENLAVEFKPKGALNGMVKTLELLSESGERRGFSLVLDMAIIEDFNFDGRILNIYQF